MTNFNKNMIAFNLHIEQPYELGYEYPRLGGVCVG